MHRCGSVRYNWTTGTRLCSLPCICAYVSTDKATFEPQRQGRWLLLAIYIIHQSAKYGMVQRLLEGYGI